jgi:hypothetical protein
MGRTFSRYLGYEKWVEGFSQKIEGERPLTIWKDTHDVALQNIHCDGVAWIGLFQDRVQSGGRSVRVLTGNVKGLSSVLFCRLLSCVAFAISVISSFVFSAGSRCILCTYHIFLVTITHCTTLKFPRLFVLSTAVFLLCRWVLLCSCSST